MSGGSLCVLALNGRRQTVKCTPNTTILQVLEEVCRKQKLKPEEYDLKHHNKILDPTTIFRFSGLPNNAQLELVPLTKLRCESEVTLALNLEDGTRLMGNFSPSATLLNVLNQLCPESLAADKNPVVVYTRREIYGQELESVTLRALGLTGGRAMVRLINKAPEELKVQANVASLLPSKPVEEKPYQRKFQPLEQSLQKNEITENSFGESSSGSTQPKSDNVPERKPEKLQKNANVDILKLARENRKSKEFTAPKSEKKRKSEGETQINQQTVSLEQCKCNDSKEVDCCGKCKENCTNMEQNTEDQFVYLGERNAMIFSLESASAGVREDIPDDFFELTINDARRIMRDINKQKSTDAPLMTSALRELEESKKQLIQLNQYRKAIIRIQFPDMSVLQGTFLPRETIADVAGFVRGYLEDKSCDFYLYFTPPRCILDESKMLIELGFVPSTVIHFGTNSQEKQSFYLRQDLKDKFTSNSVASLAASKMRNEYTRTCKIREVDDMDTDQDGDTGSPFISNDGASTSTGITHDDYGERKIVQTTEKVPKWFKP